MNKFDIVEKIPVSRLVKALTCKAQPPTEALKKVGLIKGDWQAKYFNWGRNALYALFKRLPHKTIHLPAFTCPILTDAAFAAGKKVKLLEVDLDTFDLDFKRFPKKAPECLVVVHTFGNPVDIKALKKRYPKTFIIEDCAHALFSKLKRELVGNHGDAVLFSFYKQVPNLNGALLLTKEKLRTEQHRENLISFWPRIIFKLDGWHHLLVNLLRHRYIDTLEERNFDDKITPHWLVERLFVLGLRRLRYETRERQQIWQWYKGEIKESQYLLSQEVVRYGKSSAYQFVVRLKPEYMHLRDQIVWNLRKKNIFLDRLWYSAPITEKRFFPFRKTCPKALQLANSVISLPINPGFQRRDVASLVEKLNQEVEKQL